MDATDKKAKEKIPSLDRIPLTAAATSRLDQWCHQVSQVRPGVKVSRKDLVDWLILGHEEVLSAAEERELADTHYDELKFLQYVFRELRAAKARGEDVRLQDFIDQVKPIAPTKKRSSKAKNTDNSQETTVVEEVKPAYE